MQLTSPTRRDFLKQSSLSIVALAAGSSELQATLPVKQHLVQSDSGLRELCLIGLNAARSAGASYADVRIVSKHEQRIGVRNERSDGAIDRESSGVAIRTLVDGAWGFASGNEVNRDECQRLAGRAADRARANSAAMQRPIDLAPVDGYPDGNWMTPIRRDPFRVPSAEKIDLLTEANQEALAVPGVESVESFLRFVRTQTTFASTDGSVIEQVLYRTYPSMVVTAVSADSSERQSRASTEVPPAGKGYEHVYDADLLGHARQWGEDAVAKLSAASVSEGEYDLVLDPGNLLFTIRETIGRASGLARVLGYTTDAARTPFLAPPAAVIGKLHIGPEFMNVVADRTQRGALSTVGWDDEGVPADSWPIVEDGVVVDYQTTREYAPLIADLTGNTRSHGCAVADSWNVVQTQRMPNVSLMPGEENLELDDLIAATDRGILVVGGGLATVDSRLYGFRFGGQLVHEIRAGRVGRVLKDVAYSSNTVDFWNSLDMLGGPGSYVLGGVMSGGADEAIPVDAASHGSPAARFRGVRVVRAA